MFDKLGRQTANPFLLSPSKRIIYRPVCNPQLNETKSSNGATKRWKRQEIPPVNEAPKHIIVFEWKKRGWCVSWHGMKILFVRACIGNTQMLHRSIAWMVDPNCSSASAHYRCIWTLYLLARSKTVTCSERCSLMQLQSHGSSLPSLIVSRTMMGRNGWSSKQTHSNIGFYYCTELPRLTDPASWLDPLHEWQLSKDVASRESHSRFRWVEQHDWTTWAFQMTRRRRRRPLRHYFEGQQCGQRESDRAGAVMGNSLHKVTRRKKETQYTARLPAVNNWPLIW